MKNSAWRRFLWGASLQHDVDELKRIAIRYVKEETVKPLKDLWRFVLWGALGSVFVGFGSVLVLFGALRYLQWQFPGVPRLALVAAVRDRGRSRRCRHGPHGLAHHEWRRQAPLEGGQMSEPSATTPRARELSSLVPAQGGPDRRVRYTSKPTLAAVGVGGLLAGYVWGRLRGRSVRKAKKLQKQEKQDKKKSKKGKAD